jgi:hypothetical protein
MALTPIDDAAYATLVELLDAAEDRLVRDGICRGRDANDYLAFRYIAAASGIVHGASFFVANEERVGADIFLSDLPTPKFRRLSRKRQRACVELLAARPDRFFRSFNDTLRTVLQLIMEKTSDPEELNMHGVVLLAAANVPGAAIDIRREIRRRGGSEMRLVFAGDLEQKAAIGGQIDRLGALDLPYLLNNDRLA